MHTQKHTLQNDGNKSRDCSHFENASEIEIFLLLNSLHVFLNVKKNCSREYMHKHYEAITHSKWWNINCVKYFFWLHFDLHVYEIHERFLCMAFYLFFYFLQHCFNREMKICIRKWRLNIFRICEVFIVEIYLNLLKYF
jgi:hypothetical protein